jgi:hypothetical protein
MSCRIGNWLLEAPKLNDIDSRRDRVADRWCLWHKTNEETIILHTIYLLGFTMQTYDNRRTYIEFPNINYERIVCTLPKAAK